MATRRMFSKDIVNSDAFLDMPASTQLLYFQLGMEADDDGFVASPKRVARSVGVNDDELKILTAKRFILSFPSGIVVLKHWKINNYIQADRYHETKYLEEKKALITKENGSYTECIQDVSSLDTQSSLGKVRQGKVSLGKASLSSELSSQVKEIMTMFYEGVNPTINWGNKTTLNACQDLIKRFGFDGTKNMTSAVIACQGKAYAPVATTPYQMKEKLAQFKLYFDSEKNKQDKSKPKVAFIS